MEKFSIGISLSTIAEVEKAFLAYHNQMIGGRKVALQDIRTPKFWEIKYAHREDVLARHRYDFYRLYFSGMTHPVADAQEAIGFLTRRYSDICVFIDCHYQHVDIIREWIAENFYCWVNGKLLPWQPALCFTHYRDAVYEMPLLSMAYGIDAHVEDNPHSAEGIGSLTGNVFEKGGAIMPTRPWNEDYKLDIVRRVLDWDDVLEEIKKIKQAA